MALTRGEILEVLACLGVKRIEDLKRACREYETYWATLLSQRSPNWQ